MIHEVLILAAGTGNKFWPYQSTRNKTMISISNKPLLVHSVETLLDNKIDHIVIVSSMFTDGIKHAFRKFPQVEVVHVENTKGTADTFLMGYPYLKDTKSPFVVLLGDCLIQAKDFKAFLSQNLMNSVMVSALREPATNWIACRLVNGAITEFGGHHRGNLMTHQMVAFVTGEHFVEFCQSNPMKFTNLKVGVGSPEEAYIEVSLMDAIADGNVMTAYETQEPVFDIDKPWHALEANAWLNTKRCSALKENELFEGAYIDPTARIDGFVRLGKNSRIGRNVWVRGNAIVGDDTIIDQGVILGSNIVIGNNCSLLNHAKLGDATTIGNRCLIDQGFEVLNGMILDHVYLVHYGEYYGMIGENTDLGAGTTCGTLRFDDGITVQEVNGRREYPEHFANASYMGDNSRTGVCAVLMPGVKVGSNAVIGSGVILYEDVSDNTLIYTKQELIKTPWGPNKYGW